MQTLPLQCRKVDEKTQLEVLPKVRLGQHRRQETDPTKYVERRAVQVIIYQVGNGANNGGSDGLGAQVEWWGWQRGGKGQQQCTRLWARLHTVPALARNRIEARPLADSLPLAQWHPQEYKFASLSTNDIQMFLLDKPAPDNFKPITLATGEAREAAVLKSVGSTHRVVVRGAQNPYACSFAASCYSCQRHRCVMAGKASSAQQQLCDCVIPPTQPASRMWDTNVKPNDMSCASALRLGAVTACTARYLHRHAAFLRPSQRTCRSARG